MIIKERKVRNDLTGQKFGRLIVLFRAPNIGRRVRWVCRCDCGKEKIISYANLMAGTKSCTCLANELSSKRLQKEPGQSGFIKLYNSYRNSAKSRNYTFNLTKEQFKELTNLNCHFCNIIPSKVSINVSIPYIRSKQHSTYTYNGLDRKDNKQGYTLTNSLPCCWVCNRMKRNMSYNDFIEHIKRIKHNSFIIK